MTETKNPIDGIVRQLLDVAISMPRGEARSKLDDAVSELLALKSKDGVAAALEQAIADRDYWHKAALTLAHWHIATAEYQLGLKSISKSEKGRLARIVEKSLSLLRGRGADRIESLDKEGFILDRGEKVLGRTPEASEPAPGPRP